MKNRKQFGRILESLSQQHKCSMAACFNSGGDKDCINKYGTGHLLHSRQQYGFQIHDAFKTTDLHEIAKIFH